MLFKQLKKIEGIILDVDGVLTDGKVLMTESGEQLRTFSTRDGYAIQLAIKKGIAMAAITGGNSNGVRSRLHHLGLTDIFCNVTDKVDVMNKWLVNNNLEASSIAYIGDDMPDYEVMKQVGLAACPNDAIEEIKSIARYISPKNGGDGAVRDLIEKVLKLKNLWHIESEIKSN